MRTRLKTSSPPVVTTIFLLFGVIWINTIPTFAQSQCCNSPVFGIGVESCGMRGCLECTRGELIVKKQPVDVGNAFGASGTLESASRISLFLNASDYKLFPEPLIRIRNSEVADNAFSLLTNISIFPLEPYCQKGTIFDIDNMKKRSLGIGSVGIVPETNHASPTSGNSSKFATKFGTNSSCPPVPECPSIPSAEKATEGMPILVIAITSLCWIVIFGLVLALMFLFLKRKAPPSKGFEKEFEEYAQCVGLMASYIHITYFNTMKEHRTFVENIISCFTAYEQRTAYFLKEEPVIQIRSKFDLMDEIFAEADRRDAILDQGGTLEKTKLMENFAYQRSYSANIDKAHREKDILFLISKFVESKKGIKCTDTVEILVPNQDGLSKEVLKKEKDKARKKGGKEDKRDTQKGNVDGEKEVKRQKAGMNLDVSLKTQENNMKRKKKLPEIAKHLDNTIAKWINTKPQTEEEKKIADAWLSLGVIDRLLTEFEETDKTFAKNYNEVTFQLCRIVMNEVKERTMVNNEQAYAAYNQRGKVKDTHEFIHVLEHLYTDEDPEAQKLKDFLTLYEWIRFLDLHYMGLDYNEYKGSLAYIRPSPLHDETFADAMLRLERYDDDYKKLKADVEEYCKKKKIKLVSKATPTKQLKIRDDYEFGKYLPDAIIDPPGIFEMKAEDAAKAVEDEKAKNKEGPAPRSKAARSVMSKNGAAPKSGAPPKSSAPKSSSAEPTPTSMK
ncbi:unnamed protein product [Caenorhabditis auriculariae]|uniref:Uncharacterized protein n=1 Tax=Caenorhabditis auriculariae TaxID=2777116 RepID=A0A8S1HSL6_9PELO|nr:unnamed protein product [Caenorhabditis auriculariae]